MTTNLSTLMSVTCDGEVRIPDRRAHQVMLTITPLFAGRALSSPWGRAGGSTSATLGSTNAYKVPRVSCLSALCARPAGLLVLRFVSASLPAHALVRSFAT